MVATVPASIRAGEPSGMVLPWDFGVPSLMLSPRLRSFEAGSVSPLLFHSSPSPPLVYQLSLFPLENPCKQTPFQHQSLSIRFFFPSSRFYRDRIVDTFWTRRETNPDTFPFFLSFPLLTLILIFRKRSCLWFFDSLSRFDAWRIFRTVERGTRHY